MKAINTFKQDSLRKTEKVVFDSVAGDFNIDNMSPSDVQYSRHQLFKDYTDVCMKKPGMRTGRVGVLFICIEICFPIGFKSRAKIIDLVHLITIQYIYKAIIKLNS